MLLSRQTGRHVAGASRDTALVSLDDVLGDLEAWWASLDVDVREALLRSTGGSVPAKHRSAVMKSGQMIAAGRWSGGRRESVAMYLGPLVEDFLDRKRAEAEPE
jgi:hypothetical protein